MDNVKVNPGQEDYAVTVATDYINGVHYPVYKVSYGADGFQTPVDEINQLPVMATDLNQAVNFVQKDELIEAVERLEKQLKIMNIHLQSMTGEKITKGDIDG